MIRAPRRDIWTVVTDPYHLPRWWPNVTRVEGVYERKGGSGTQWTKVFETQSGKVVRADYRARYARDAEAYGWEQDIPGSPFEKYLRSAVTAIALSDADGGTLVEIQTDQKLRGLSRFGGGAMLKRATGRQLDQALDALEHALVDDGRPDDAG